MQTDDGVSARSALRALTPRQTKDIPAVKSGVLTHQRTAQYSYLAISFNRVLKWSFMISLSCGVGLPFI